MSAEHRGAFGPGPDGEPLTEDEVASLSEGTPVVVIWTGGNGPHRYVVSVDVHGQRHVWNGTAERLRFYNPLRFVGQERFHTRVWLDRRPAPMTAEIRGEHGPEVRLAPLLPALQTAVRAAADFEDAQRKAADVFGPVSTEGSGELRLLIDEAVRAVVEREEQAARQLLRSAGVDPDDRSEGWQQRAVDVFSRLDVDEHFRPRRPDPRPRPTTREDTPR